MGSLSALDRPSHQEVGHGLTPTSLLQLRELHKLSERWTEAVIPKTERKESESAVTQSVPLFETPCTIAHQAPPSMGFSGKSTGVVAIILKGKCV